MGCDDPIIPVERYKCRSPLQCIRLREHRIKYRSPRALRNAVTSIGTGPGACSSVISRAGNFRRWRSEFPLCDNWDAGRYEDAYDTARNDKPQGP